MNSVSAGESGCFCSQIIENYILTNKDNMITSLARRNKKSRDRVGYHVRVDSPRVTRKYQRLLGSRRDWSCPAGKGEHLHYTPYPAEVLGITQTHPGCSHMATIEATALIQGM